MKTQLFLFALLLAASPARAELTAGGTDAAAAPAPAKKKNAKKKTKRASPGDAIKLEGVQEVTLPMARGELEAEVAADVAQRERANAPHTKVELGASSWKPARVTTGSRVANATDFRTKGIPALEVSVLSPIAGRELHLEFGMGFLAMQRTGSIETAGLSVPVDQNGYVTTIRLGVAYSPWMLLGDKLVPYASAAVLPSMLITRASSFDDGVNDTGVPFEVGAGALYRISKPVSLDVGVHEVMGRVQDSDFKGFGVRAGVRVAI